MKVYIVDWSWRDEFRFVTPSRRLFVTEARASEFSDSLWKSAERLGVLSYLSVSTSEVEAE